MNKFKHKFKLKEEIFTEGDLVYWEEDNPPIVYKLKFENLLWKIEELDTTNDEILSDLIYDNMKHWDSKKTVSTTGDKK